MRKIYFIISILILIIFFDSSVFANPYMPDLYSSKSNSVIWALVAFPSLMIEYLIVRILLSPQVKFWRAFRLFFVINLITFPITQILGMSFIWFAELVPLICEPIMYEGRLRMANIVVPRLRQKIVIANLISFALGIIFYRIIPILNRMW